ncbi:hypothetical protein KKA50_03130 [Patescibacteria group bacterium]|nr:hypothetical protein [Patescibacteria group bacterium]
MDAKIVKREEIQWKVMQIMLAQEGIKLTVQQVNNYYTERVSGVGKIAGLDYCFILSENKTALLTVTTPKTEKQRKAIKRFVGLVSNAESQRLVRLPTPNSGIEIPELKALVVEWGYADSALREKETKKLFRMARIIEL